jgi:hypothetical protein
MIAAQTMTEICTGAAVYGYYAKEYFISPAK